MIYLDNKETQKSIITELKKLTDSYPSNKSITLSKVDAQYGYFPKKLESNQDEKKLAGAILIPLVEFALSIGTDVAAEMVEKILSDLLNKISIKEHIKSVEIEKKTIKFDERGKILEIIEEKRKEVDIHR